MKKFVSLLLALALVLGLVACGGKTATDATTDVSGDVENSESSDVGNTDAPAEPAPVEPEPAPVEPEPAPVEPEPAPVAEPIATVVTGDKTVEVATVPALTKAIDPSGNSVVTFLKDLQYNGGEILLPYSCTVDLGGHTIKTNPAEYNGFTIDGVGTENKVTTIKNGTVVYNYHGVRVNAGGIVLSNLTMHGLFAECLTLYVADPSFNDKNLIENCVLISDVWGSIAWNEKDVDYSKTAFTIRDTDLISRKPGGVALVDVGQGNCIGGTINLGTGVNFYAYTTKTYVGNTIQLAGETMTLAEEGTATVEIPQLDMKIEKLNKWSTPATAS